MTLEPIALGNGVSITWPVALSPMAGVSDAVFRGLCRDHDCGYATTEFARDRAVLMGVPDQVALCDVRTDTRPVGVQLFGASPDELRRAAALVMERWAPDALDINMGCPAPKVTSGQGGSSLLRDPGLATAIVDAVAREIAPAPVTVKIRVGWDDAHKAAGAAVDVARRVVDVGAQLVTVHGRTRTQRYEGYADWDVISQVAAALSVPVVGNGDITTPEEAAHRLRTSGCRGISIGRGARGRPWVFKQIRTYIEEGVQLPDPPATERVQLGLEHIRRQRAYERMLVDEDSRYKRKPEAERAQIADMRTLGRMLAHVMWYVWGVPGAAVARRALSKCRSGSELEDVLSDFAARPERYQDVHVPEHEAQALVAADACPE
ncbi:MAG: tRNA-dihydrouridine synthase DusB [uncultured Chloroflexi bacterium]|uniref:tRNA-dihydrouridine synthase DusB n=1 Tax=uncultured Chloroflexota bacterium TaxID=166587 RepID=A0A6J4K580_9CHLR|nr:MAG: tRNA-dihydrouridine synthase DusB [uncultured Chloroflexota bacterium]